MIILKAYAPNNKASKYMKQNLTKLKGEIDKSTIIVGNCNMYPLIIDRTTVQEIHNNIENVNICQPT